MKNEYFINTSARRSADPGFFAAMLVRFVLHVRRVRVVQLNPSLDVKAIIRDGILLLVAKLFHKPVIVFFFTVGMNDLKIFYYGSSS